jgi:spectinomycin phosphotransferase
MPIVRRMLIDLSSKESHLSMLEKPNISDDAIIACLDDSFGLHIGQVTFLPLGWVNNALYRVIADNGIPYFLKLRRGLFNEIAVAIPAFLRSQGIRQVVAPIATTANTLWVRAHGFDWTLYPFFDGKTGFEVSLSKPHWIALGQGMKAIHATRLSATLAEHIPQEDYSPRLRNIVRAFHKQVEGDRYADPIAARLAAFWMIKHDEIQSIVERADQLAQALQRRKVELVVCHSDLHGRNVLVGANDEVAIVDWDEPILAPKERDLMFIGGGVGGIWNNDQEVAWFYQGYGQTDIDLVELCYYRYERIVVDIAGCAEQIFGMQGSVEERQKGLGLANQFLPNNVVDIAHRTYQRLSEAIA